MTERVQSLTVVLDKDIRKDDVQALMQAIRQLRHVSGVEANVVDMRDFTARMRVDEQWREALFQLIRDKIREPK